VDPQLRKTCRQRIWVAQLSAVDSFGDPSFGSPQPFMARVEDDQETEDRPEGEERLSRKRIVTEEQIRITDRVWLPGDSPTEATLARTPRSVQELPDERGVIDHYETIV